MKLASHPKGWQKTWFYCKDTSPNQQKLLSSYRYGRLDSSKQFTFYASVEERPALEPMYSKINALIAHGLSAIDLTRCWMSWRIQPLSLRNRLMHEYTGELEDDLHFSDKELSSSDLMKAIKKLLGETREKIAIVGFAPFFAGNPTPEVAVFIYLQTYAIFCFF
uniref:Uncharacterized protein n=1 Tax=Aegilops tauschii subsp. strangulata TaxID=200361 RepID=A0A453A316_AEGTS